MAPLILSVFSTFGVGGPQVRFAALATHFGRQYRHAIIAMDGETACRTRLPDNIDVTFPEVTIRKGDTLGNMRRFRRMLQWLRPDVLITSNWGSMEWAMANAVVGIRHVHAEDGFGPEEIERQLYRRVLVRRLFLRRSVVVLPSKSLHRMASELWWLDPKRLRYIPNGVDFARFRMAPIAAEYPGDGPVIGCVGALREVKNIARLLRAFEQTIRERPARLVIVGDGPDRGRLQSLAGELGIASSVHFTGYFAEPEPLYGGFDLFALSSDTEQMPLAILDAMAAGLPIAATDVGDVRTMVSPENHSFLVPRDDAALARALSLLIADPSLRARLGAANRAKAAQDHDWNKMLEAWHELLPGCSEPRLRRQHARTNFGQGITAYDQDRAARNQAKSFWLRSQLRGRSSTICRNPNETLRHG